MIHSEGNHGPALLGGRGGGFVELLLEEPNVTIELLFAIVTQLGDVWFLFLLGAVVYVGGETLPRLGIQRRRGMFVLALALAAVAAIQLVKPLLGVPRPPGAAEPLELTGVPPLLERVLVDITTADGYGFPSGHAFGSTIVWGGFALVLDRGSARVRFGAAGVIVALVSLSRLVLGVHYPIDVLAGVALGLLVLGALYLLAERGTVPGRVLAVSVTIGVVALFVTVSNDTVAVTGAAVGASLAWSAVADQTPPRPSNRRAALAGLVSIGATGVIFGVVYLLEPSHVVAFLGTAVAVGVTVVAPFAGERLFGT